MSAFSFFPSIGIWYERVFFQSSLSMKEYIGMNTLISCPISESDWERAPTTSASPPDFEKGTVSLVTIKIFMFILSIHLMRGCKDIFSP